MTVYVDDVRHSFGRMTMCHLWANTDKELLRMVDIIGVQRKWIQGHPKLSFGKHRNASWVHFDISLGKKKLALQNGAVLTDKFGPVEHCAKLLLKAAREANNQAMVDRAFDKLSMVASARGVRAIIEKEKR
jgi:hypothetical protein